MDRKKHLCQYLAHAYFFCSVVGILLLPSANDLAIFLLSLGASSVYISIGVFLTASVNKFWGICAFLWTIIFPILLIASYVCANRKHYGMLLLAMILDAMVSLLFAVYTISTQNWYGLRQAIVFIIVGFCVLFCFVRIIHKSNAE